MSIPRVHRVDGYQVVLNDAGHAECGCWMFQSDNTCHHSKYIERLVAKHLETVKRNSQPTLASQAKRAAAKSYKFESETTPGRFYTTLEHVGGELTCDCAGWCKRVAANGSRSCKHTREVAAGMVAERVSSSTTVLRGPSLVTFQDEQFTVRDVEIFTALQRGTPMPGVRTPKRPEPQSETPKRKFKWNE